MRSEKSGHGIDSALEVHTVKAMASEWVTDIEGHTTKDMAMDLAAGTEVAGGKETGETMQDLEETGGEGEVAVTMLADAGWRWRLAKTYPSRVS